MAALPSLTAPGFDPNPGLYGVNYLDLTPGAQVAADIADEAGSTPGLYNAQGIPQINIGAQPDAQAGNVTGTSAATPPSPDAGPIEQGISWVETNFGKFVTRAGLVILGIVIIAVALSMFRSNKIELVNAKK